MRLHYSGGKSKGRQGTNSRYSLALRHFWIFASSDIHTAYPKVDTIFVLVRNGGVGVCTEVYKHNMQIRREKK